MALPGPSADASAWGDVQLPDAPVPDGFVLTQLDPDGGTSTVDPTVACAAIGTEDAGVDGATSPATDAALDAPRCAPPVAPGDLVFDEVMISTEAGSGDRGQWLEVRSTRACSLDLRGLHASAPHGQSFHTVDVTADLWLPPFGLFLIADTTDSTENDELPGLVLAWAGAPADALHKTSDTVTLSLGAVALDTLSYPSKKRAAGTSMAFPAGCSPRLRADFASWQPSVASWTPGLRGTPGAPNTDVACAAPAIPTCAAARERAR